MSRHQITKENNLKISKCKHLFTYLYCENLGKSEVSQGKTTFLFHHIYEGLQSNCRGSYFCLNYKSCSAEFILSQPQSIIESLQKISL